MTETAPILCPHCSAKQLGPSENCWLCSKSLSDENAGLPPVVAVPASEPAGLSFSLATLFLMMTLASVCMGLLVAVPGLGVLACIVMVPVFIRTVRVVRHREVVGFDVSPAQKATLFLTSFAVTSVLVIVVCVSAFCSFCGVCLTLISVASPQDDMLAWGIGNCVAAIVGIFAAVKITQASRRRYRRDMGGE